MAKITINPSQMKVNLGRQTNLTQLGINPDLFTRNNTQQEHIQCAQQ